MTWLASSRNIPCSVIPVLDAEKEPVAMSDTPTLQEATEHYRSALIEHESAAKMASDRWEEHVRAKKLSARTKTALDDALNALHEAALRPVEQKTTTTSFNPWRGYTDDRGVVRIHHGCPGKPEAVAVCFERPDRRAAGCVIFDIGAEHFHVAVYDRKGEPLRNYAVSIEWEVN